MGTNYYLHLDICDKCNREHKKIHIGKASGGWKFLFRAYKYTDDNFPEIKSMAQWYAILGQSVLQNSTMKIRDEYDRDISFAEFSNMVSIMQGNPNNKSHHEYCVKEGYNVGDRIGTTWIDEYGYDFSSTEFS